MKNINFFLISVLMFMVLISCKEEEIDGHGYLVVFTPDIYMVDAVGGEVLTTIPNHEFKLFFSRNGTDVYHTYYANESGDYIKTDFFTAERTADYRIRFNVQPNTTGRSRTYVVEVEAGNEGRGFVYLTQMAE